MKVDGEEQEKIEANQDVDMKNEEVKQEEKVVELPKVSESLKRFIEQDNKAYADEIKQGKTQKEFNKDFFRELQKTMAINAAKMIQQ